MRTVRPLPPIEHHNTAHPAHEYVCTYCDMIHPESMFRGTKIEGMSKDCAEKKIKRDRKTKNEKQQEYRAFKSELVPLDKVLDGGLMENEH